MTSAWKYAQWIGLPVGIAMLIGMVVHQGAADLAQIIGRAGAALLYLVPLRGLPVLLDAYAWHLLLDRRISLLFLWWVATVREAVGRLLPVASIGGDVVGIRLAAWRLTDLSAATASVIVEVLVTIVVQYAFSASGILLMAASPKHGDLFHAMALGLVLTIPVPVMAFMVFRRGDLFQKIERLAERLLGDTRRVTKHIDGRVLDRTIRDLLHRPALLAHAFLWQLAGYVVGTLETYYALELLGSPVSLSGALAIEALSQAVRHIAFVVPAGIGVQDAAVVVLAQSIGVQPDIALSLALVKRAREMLSGVAALISWQAVEIIRERRGKHQSA